MIELMISVTIGLFIMGAIGYLYISSRGAYHSNAALARIQEDGRFGLDAVTRDARAIGALGCSAAATIRTVAANPLTLPGANGAAITFAGPATAIYGFAPTGPFTPPTGGPVAPPPWIAGDVLQMVIPTSKPVALLADADNVNYTVTLADNTAQLQNKDFLLVSNCGSASITSVVSIAGTAPAVVSLSPAALLPSSVIPQMTLAAHASAQRVDAVTYYVGQFAGRPWPALYRYSATYGVAEEVIDHVENMSVLYGVGNLAPVPAATIAGNNDWPNVTSLRIALQIVGDDQSTAGALVPVNLAPTPGGAVPLAPDTRLRQIFTATAGLRNRLP
jgi:type IV pilus assembly protein PilW